MTLGRYARAGAGGKEKSRDIPAWVFRRAIAREEWIMPAASNVSRSRGFAFIWLVAPLVLLVAASAGMFYGPAWLGPYMPQIVSYAVAAILAITPLIACMVQTISRDRQSQKLDGVIFPAIKQTRYFQIAKASLDSIMPASIGEADYRVPLLLFATIISFCSLFSFMGLFWPDNLRTPSFILSGMTDFRNLDDLQRYQQGTIAAAGIAFIGAYLALFHRLLGQLNNNDIYPISFHYYSAWLLAAMFIAAVYRHVMTIFGLGPNAEVFVVLVSFAIGALPAPFFSALLHFAFNKLNITGDKNDPASGTLPSNLNLLMIDGLANEKIDRLGELGITDAQVLSCQNPFTLWARLPYDLPLIVDWIAQAQLYVCLRDEGMRAARVLEIGDIHKFTAVLADERAMPDLCAALGLKPSFVAPLLASLNENPAYVRLREVKLAMLDAAPPHQQTAPTPLAMVA